MKKSNKSKLKIYIGKGLLPVCVILSLLFSITSLAKDLVLDYQPELNSFNGQSSLTVFDRTDSFLGSSEIWLNQWGVSGTLFENKSSDVFGLPSDSQYFNVNIKRRFGSKNRSNLELGLGWQELNIESELDASGPRVSLEGHVKILPSFEFYGSTSYFPELDDSINDSTATAYELEAGLLYSPLPSLSLKAGYRVFNLDLDEPNIRQIDSSAGFLLGSDWRW